jgi:hypothetical protein
MYDRSAMVFWLAAFFLIVALVLLIPDPPPVEEPAGEDVVPSTSGTASL